VNRDLAHIDGGSGSFSKKPLHGKIFIKPHELAAKDRKEKTGNDF
jgi:hypothetical protein